MKVTDLRRAIAEAAADARFAVSTRPETGGGLPDAVTAVEPRPTSDQPNQWVVFYTERGEIIDPHYFDSEEAACDYAYSILRRPPRAIRKLSANERERVLELARESAERRKDTLLSAGIDPMTGRPLSSS